MAIPRRTLLHWAASAGALACAPLARAQAGWPSKPIRIIVPYEAGGLSDVTARQVGKELSSRLGQPVVVENKPGATQVIGATYVQKAPADGYTLFFASLTSMVLNKYGFSGLPYDPQKDFQPLSLVTQTPLFLYVNSKFPAKNLQEFLREVKAKPGVYSYASLGHGSSYHVVMEMFKAATGIDIKHVPYKGSAPGMLALLKDEVQVMFDVGGISTQYVREGKLRPLAVTGSHRAAGVPDVPTLAELGIPGFELAFWFGLVAPAGTPKPIVDRLSSEIAQIVQSPDFRERAEKTGFYSVSTTPAEFSALIESDLARWEKGFKAAKIEPVQL
jgi:tripartite-type tricarboxylate transporter receptor subunit TctC